jgi:glycosyltransferase involved in cell wall biosynthesis
MSKTTKRVQPKISVIVPIYKVEKYLVQCIDSIINQTLKNIEVILVDEGDMDACRFICDHYEKADKRIKTIHEKNGGYGASVNRGLDIATGEYISIIESDDFIEPTMYEQMYAYAKKLNADVVKTPYIEYWDKTKNFPEKKQLCPYAHKIAMICPKNKVFSILECPQLMGIHASLWSGIYKTAYLKSKKIKFIEAKGGAYVDVGFRIDTLINTNRIAWLDQPFYNYRLSNDGSTTNNFNLDAMMTRWKEVHKKFRNKKDLYAKIGPYSVVDEYLNTAGYLFVENFNITEEQIKKMENLFNYIPEEVICKAPDLSQQAKDTMIQVKNGTYLETLNISKSTGNKSSKHWYSCHIALHLNKSKIHLFRYIRHKIFHLLIRCGGLYTLDFSIGKVK